MSAIKGFISNTVTRSIEHLGKTYQMMQHYVSLKGIGSDSYGLQTTPSYSGVVAQGLSLDAGPIHTKNALLITGHGLKVGDTLLFTGAGSLQYQEPQVISVVDVNTIIVAPALPSPPTGGELFTQRRAVAPSTDMSGNLLVTSALISVVDSLDSGMLVPTGANSVPKLTSNALQIVASLASNVTKIQVIHDLGEPMNLYLDAARTQFLCHLPLTPDESVSVQIAAGSAVFLGAARDIDINDAASFMEINFIG